MFVGWVTSEIGYCCKKDDDSDSESDNSSDDDQDGTNEDKTKNQRVEKT